MNDRFRISSLLAGRLAEHKVALPTLLRRAGLPAGFFQQEKIYATTAELFALWRAIAETSADAGITFQHKLKKFYEGFAIPADSFARAVVFAMSQPDDVDINEILFRPTLQEL